MMDIYRYSQLHIATTIHKVNFHGYCSIKTNQVQKCFGIEMPKKVNKVLQFCSFF